MVEEHPWWRDAVIYQIYPRSWADGNGDGVGDLPGITARLPHLVELGVDALWLSPFYVSPQRDAGYDVADYRNVDPLFGDVAAADALLERAHDLGLKVMVDLVPNHTSSDHPWFQEALASPPGSDARARYLFRPGSGPTGDLPPNDWMSVFGGPAWTQVTPGDAAASVAGQWYLHLFDSSQPDLDWTHPQVRSEFEDILRFWLDRGVDGFRVDVAHGLVKAPGLPDWGREQKMLQVDAEGAAAAPPVAERPRPPMWDQDGVHDIYRSWRQILTQHHRERPSATEPILCAEAWVDPPERLAAYVRPDEMHQAFNFSYLQAAWNATDQRQVIEQSLRWCASVNAPTTWVLSNHDVVRHASRLGLPTARQDGRGPVGIGAHDPQPDADLGLQRARAATALLLALPGSAYLYQGEELGLPEHSTLADSARQDPTWPRSGFTEAGRDGCRVPMPWEAASPAYGFNDTGRTWLPQPPTYGALAVDQQRGVAGSTYEMYRTLLQLRREHRVGRGQLVWEESPAEVLMFRAGLEGTMRVVANLGQSPVPLPPGRVVVSSGPCDDGYLPADTTVWMSLPD
ncbi:glycoside hydrolase family 13 protein [Austwickia sp. TVS 96-490-7B]|uniref:glycoside hydrolase family 13 protein n=1 Tax=Austwickia sp. TVS 96-490-7B TaxID=2830843 RepID=UPI001C591855|nr:glycoside hydrolase family 13 protein [Austwickia sp. TVS 96-490-7B]